MAYSIGSVTNGGGKLAHQNLLPVIEALANANGWTTMRYADTAGYDELILRGEGLSGTEQIFVGFRTYQSVAADYYNILAGTFTGYAPSEVFDMQPGRSLSGVCAHNLNIDHFITLNEQCITLGLKLGSPAVFEHAHVGRFLPYGTPAEYPMPLVNIGMLNAAAATRYSDTSHAFGYRGDRINGRIRDQAGAWIQASIHPWSEPMIAGDGTAGGVGHGRPTGGLYWMEPLQIHDANNVYGVIDGVFQVTGFDNQSERVIQLGGSYTVDDTGKTLVQVVAEILEDAEGRAFVVMQDVGRSGFNDHIALEMR